MAEPGHNTETMSFERILPIMKSEFGNVAWNIDTLKYGWTQFIKPHLQQDWPTDGRQLPAGTTNLPAQGLTHAHRNFDTGRYRPSQLDYSASYGGSQAGYSGSHGGPMVGHNQPYGTISTVQTNYLGGPVVGSPNQPQTYQQNYGDAYSSMGPNTNFRPGAAPNVYNTFDVNRTGYRQQYGANQPGQGGRHLPLPSPGQILPSMAAARDPVNQGNPGGSRAQRPQPSRVGAQPEAPGQDVRENWSMRQNWIYDCGKMVDGVNYTWQQLEEAHKLHWNRVAVRLDVSVEEEFYDLERQMRKR